MDNKGHLKFFGIDANRFEWLLGLTTRTVRHVNDNHITESLPKIPTQQRQ